MAAGPSQQPREREQEEEEKEPIIPPSAAAAAGVDGEGPDDEEEEGEGVCLFVNRMLRMCADLIDPPCICKTSAATQQVTRGVSSFITHTGPWAARSGGRKWRGGTRRWRRVGIFLSFLI